VPEEYGGRGYTYVELIVVLEEMGRALLCAPYFSTVALAANTLLVSGDDAAKKEFLPGIAGGETIATLAFTEDSGRWDEAGITMEAAKSGDGYTLSGHKMFVLDGHVADLIVVAARTSGGVSLFAVAGDASGSDPHPVVDHGPDPQAGPPGVLQHARQAHRHRGRRLGRSLNKVLDPGRGGVGGRAGRRRPEGAGDVGRLRQEPRPVRPAHRQLPGHQAQVRRHAARGRVGQVGRLLRRLGAAEDNDELPVVAAWPRPTARTPTSTPRREHPDPRRHRLHVGAPAHLYFKRAKSSELLFGDPSYHRELLAQRIGI
jgi:alkylation response protein AidB-like acyl-CoA dehydrogenase